MIKFLKWSAISIGVLCLLGITVWAILAIYYSYLPQTARTVFAVVYPLVILAILIYVRPRRWAIGLVMVCFIVVLGGWFSMEPSNSRDWQPDVAVLPHATISGNMVTVHNIRNCDYRSETDYTVDHYDRTFDVSEMTSVDLYMVDWGIGYIVHTMMSFGFEGEQYLCISIETRKEKGENYSTVKGFFRQYESFYVVADERDVVRLRTNYRKGETVYLYRLIGSSLDVGREVFLDYMRYINHLKEKPEWYNALTGNCTTQIRGRARPYAENARWDWRFLANGYIDTMAYERGIFDQTFSLEELKRRSIINARAREVGSDTEFSKLIRRGLPGMSQ